MKNQAINCFLIDDEQDAIAGLEILLENIEGVKVVAKHTNPIEALKKLEQTQIDVVFLDIDMPQLNGFEVLDKIIEKQIDCKVIFVTAFNQYILKALRKYAFDYLTKPVDRLQLKETITRIRQTGKNNSPKLSNLKSMNMLKIPVVNGCIFLKNDDIIYLEADGNYSKIITEETEIVSSKNLGKFETELCNNGFLKISKSLIINLRFISEFERKKRICKLKTDEKTYELTVSRRNIHVFDKL